MGRGGGGWGARGRVNPSGRALPVGLACERGCHARDVAGLRRCLLRVPVDDVGRRGDTKDQKDGQVRALVAAGRDKVGEDVGFKGLKILQHNHQGGWLGSGGGGGGRGGRRR